MNRSLIKPSLNAAALSGVIATFPMTFITFTGRRLLSARPSFFEKQPTMKNMDVIFKKKNQEIKSLSVKNSDEPILWSRTFAYGMAAATLYPIYRCLLPKKVSDLNVGAFYGVLVWIGKTKGLYPISNKAEVSNNLVLKATDNATSIVSHIVWGATLGFCYSLLKNSSASTKSNKTKL